MKNIALSFPIQLRAIALVTAIALLAWAFGLPVWVQNANAANVIQFSDTLSDSDRDVEATHTIRFTTETLMNTGEFFRIYFDEELTGPGTTFDLSGLNVSDISGTGMVAVAACGAGTDVEFIVGTNYIQGEICGSIPAATAVELTVGNVGQIVNPDPGAGVPESYVISLQGYGASPIADSGDTRVAIIDDVTVTADVDTIFDFTISGVAQGTAVNGDTTVTSTSSTATAIPFDTIAPGTPKLVAQLLEVDTNALNGFSVSVFADQTLTSENGATIDPFDDGVPSASTTPWSGPANTFGNTLTYGHWGLTSDDDVISNTTDERWGGSVGETWYTGEFVNSPVEVFYHNAAVDSLQGAQGEGHTTVAYKVEIGVFQEAAKDYTATLTYIATPVF